MEIKKRHAISPFSGVHGNNRVNGLYFVGKKILDLGCGFMTFNNLTPPHNHDVVTVDWREKVKPDYCCNILDGLPFEDGTFDIVWNSHFLEHFLEDSWNKYEGGDDLDSVLQEIVRVLKPDGEMIWLLIQITRQYILQRCGMPYFKDIWIYWVQGVLELGLTFQN